MLEGLFQRVDDALPDRDAGEELSDEVLKGILTAMSESAEFQDKHALLTVPKAHIQLKTRVKKAVTATANGWSLRARDEFLVLADTKTAEKADSSGGTGSAGEGGDDVDLTADDASGDNSASKLSDAEIEIILGALRSSDSFVGEAPVLTR